jgi:hypothetical protein
LDPFGTPPVDRGRSGPKADRSYCDVASKGLRAGSDIDADRTGNRVSEGGLRAGSNGMSKHA